MITAASQSASQPADTLHGSNDVVLCLCKGFINNSPVQTRWSQTEGNFFCKGMRADGKHRGDPISTEVDERFGGNPFLHQAVKKKSPELLGGAEVRL